MKGALEVSSLDVRDVPYFPLLQMIETQGRHPKHLPSSPLHHGKGFRR